MGFINDKKVSIRLNELAEILRISTPEFQQSSLDDKLDAMQKAIEELYQEANSYQYVDDLIDKSQLSPSDDSSTNGYAPLSGNNQSSVEPLLAENEGLKAQINSLTRERESIISALQEKNALIAELENQLQQRDSQIQEQKQDKNHEVIIPSTIIRGSEDFRGKLTTLLKENKDSLLNRIEDGSEDLYKIIYDLTNRHYALIDRNKKLSLELNKLRAQLEEFERGGVVSAEEQESIEELNRKLFDKVGEIDHLKKMNSQLKAELSDLQDEIEKIRSEQASSQNLQQELLQKDSENKRLNELVYQFKSTISELQDDIEKLRSEQASNQNLQQELLQKDSDMELLRKMNSKLQEDLSALQVNIDQIRSEQAASQNNQQELLHQRAENQRLSELNSKLMAEVNKLSYDLDKSQTEIKIKDEKIALLEATIKDNQLLIQELSQTKVTLVDKNNKLSSEFDEYRSKGIDFHLTIERLKEKIDELESRLSEKEEEISSMDVEIFNLKKEKYAQEKSLQSAQEELETTKAQLETEKDLRDEKESIIRTLTQAQASQGQENASSQKEIESLNQKLFDMDTQFQMFKMERRELVQELRTLHKDLCVLRADISQIAQCGQLYGENEVQIEQISRDLKSYTERTSSMLNRLS